LDGSGLTVTGRRETFQGLVQSSIVFVFQLWEGGDKADSDRKTGDLPGGLCRALFFLCFSSGEDEADSDRKTGDLPGACAELYFSCVSVVEGTRLTVTGKRETFHDLVQRFTS